MIPSGRFQRSRTDCGFTEKTGWYGRGVDDQARYEALKGEFEIEHAYLVRPDGEAKIKNIRVFKDKGGLVRIDIAPLAGDDEQLQLVVGRDQLMALLDGPQDALDPGLDEE